MERIKRFLHRKLDGYTIDEYIVMGICISIFLPFYITLATILLAITYLCFTGKIKAVLTSVPKAGYLYCFIFMITLLSLISGNDLGALCSVGILVIFIFILYFRMTVTKRLFEFIMDACCLLSWFCARFAFTEFYGISHALGFRFLKFAVVDDPNFRINSTFFNANYYAMMIEFLILICIYKMMKVQSFRRIVYYLITIACNLMALYLSGCRTAWAPFAITIPLMFFLNHKTLYFRTTMAIYGIGALILVINPDLFPRFDTLVEYFVIRVDIWKAAWRGIVESPLFGKGPLTYFHTYAELGGPYTQHAHNVMLDPLLSFGVIPILFAGVYMYDRCKEIWQLYSQRINIRLFSLIIGFILTVLLHGIFDYTIFWVQTALLFLVVAASPSMYIRERDKTE